MLTVNCAVKSCWVGSTVNGVGPMSMIECRFYEQITDRYFCLVYQL